VDDHENAEAAEDLADGSLDPDEVAPDVERWDEGSDDETEEVVEEGEEGEEDD
jgi:hypothetical protein